MRCYVAHRKSVMNHNQVQGFNRLPNHKQSRFSQRYDHFEYPLVLVFGNIYWLLMFYPLIMIGRKWYGKWLCVMYVETVYTCGRKWTEEKNYRFRRDLNSDRWIQSPVLTVTPRNLHDTCKSVVIIISICVY